MSGERNLDRLLQGMSPKLDPGTYVFASAGRGAVPDGLSPRMRFEEDEGTTLVLPLAEAEAHGLEFGFRCRMITLAVHSSLDAVGFMARVAAALAEGGVAANPVSGKFHDHLFVPEERAGEAMRILERLGASAKGDGAPGAG